MTAFDLRSVDLESLESATRYPSIPTYHQIDPANGMLTDTWMQFPGTVIGTEKVDGTNARIILTPDGRWLLGSRKELLTAAGDIVSNPAQGIVGSLRTLAANLLKSTGGPINDQIITFYVELYGIRDTQAWKQYSDGSAPGWRLFDVAVIDSAVVDWPRPAIASWRDHHGYRWYDEGMLADAERVHGIPLVPRLFVTDAANIPTGLADMTAFLNEHAPTTRVAVGGHNPGRAEGIVLRTPDRIRIAKARHQDYNRARRAFPHTRRADVGVAGA